MSSSWPYQTTIQPYGIPAYSNVPFDQPQPPNTNYSIDLNWSVPVAQLASYSFDIVNAFGGLAAAIQSQGYSGTITNVQVSTPSATTSRVSFTASSPAALLVVLAIVGLSAVVSWLILSIVTTVTTALGPVFPFVAAVATVAAAVGLGVFVYSFIRSGQVRHESAKIVGGTLSSGRKVVRKVRGVSGAFHRATHLDESEEP